MQIRLFDKTNGRLTEWPTGHGTTDGQGRYLMPSRDWQRDSRRIASSGSWCLSGPMPRPTNGHGQCLGGTLRKAQSVDLTLGPLTDTEFLVLDPDGTADRGSDRRAGRDQDADRLDPGFSSRVLVAQAARGHRCRRPRPALGLAVRALQVPAGCDREPGHSASAASRASPGTSPA